MAPRIGARTCAVSWHSARAALVSADDDAELSVSGGGLAARWPEAADRVDLVEEHVRARAARRAIRRLRHRVEPSDRRRRRTDIVLLRFAGADLLAGRCDSGRRNDRHCGAWR